MSSTPEGKGACGDMSPDEFRRQGHMVVDWVADYLRNVSSYPVLSAAAPGEIRQQLPPQPPLVQESIEQVLEDLERVILPGITHWNHPAFFAYFAISGSGPGILAEMISAALNVNGMLWKTSPAATELEEVVLDWLRQMLGLPSGWFGIVYDTASVATLCALAAAREAVPGLRLREEGLTGRSDIPRLRMYTSEQAHSSVEKAALTLGLGRAGVGRIPVDDEFRMQPDALQRAIEEDLRRGAKPFCVVATVGTTSTTSIDPVPQIAEICSRHGLWLHVDAAYGGSAAILPEMRHVLAGCDRADSFVVNPHKWLFVPIDFTAFYCKRREVLRRAFSLVPDYLQTAEDGAVDNLMDYGISLGRRFRALKFWMVLRYFGQEGLSSRLREHIRLARLFASWVDGDEDFERMTPVPFALVCFRSHPRNLKPASGKSSAGIPMDGVETYLNRLNEALLDSVNRTGEIYLSQTKLNNRVVLRLSVGNIRTTESDVRHAWKLLRTHASDLHAKLGVELLDV